MMVPIVSKKSESMTEKMASSAVTVPRRANKPKSSRPKVEKSGACTSAWGSWAAPGVAKPFQPAKSPLSAMATSVVTMMPISSAPRTRLARSTAVRMNPSRNTTMGKPFSTPRPTGNGPAAGLTTKPDVKNPIKAMKSPMPTPIARLSPIGTAVIIASRKRVSTSTVMATPSQNTTVIACGHVSPRPATSSKATTAFSPIPGASANGYFANTPMAIESSPAVRQVTVSVGANGKPLPSRPGTPPKPLGLGSGVARGRHPRRTVARTSRVYDLAMAPPTTLLEVADLSVKFPSRGGAVEAVSGVSFALARGRVVCLLGESGSGKSVTLRSIVRLNYGARTTGTILLDGQNVLAMSRREIRDSRRGAAAMVFQEPMTALDPVYTIGAQIEVTVRRHRNVNRIDARRRALELLELVQIASPARCLAAYPHELSGGMRQRVMIAIALACDPALLLADEPTTALDVTVQAQILWLLRDLQRRLGLGLTVVTHDLAVAAGIAADALA